MEGWRLLLARARPSVCAYVCVCVVMVVVVDARDTTQGPRER